MVVMPRERIKFFVKIDRGINETPINAKNVWYAFASPWRLITYIYPLSFSLSLFQDYVI
jgi:hypothetical protein